MHYFTYQGHVVSEQTKLLEEFPDEGGVRDPTKRILPFLPGAVQKLSHTCNNL